LTPAPADLEEKISIKISIPCLLYAIKICKNLIRARCYIMDNFFVILFFDDDGKSVIECKEKLVDDI